MPSTVLQDSFSNSYSKFEDYPRNLILSGTYDRSKLEWIHNRLEERTRHLFVDDKGTDVHIEDVSSNGLIIRKKLSSDMDLQEWLGAMYQAGPSETLVATKMDPRCRFV